VYGDILVLNKCDLVDAERLVAVEARLREIKPDARILHASHGDVPLSMLLSVGLFETDLLVALQDQEALRKDHDHHVHHGQDHQHNHHQSHDHVHNHADAHTPELEGFRSVSLAADAPFDLRRFQHFLDKQLPANVFRAKGVLWFRESNRRHLFHLCGKRFTIDDSDWPQGSLGTPRW